MSQKWFGVFKTQVFTKQNVGFRDFLKKIRNLKKNKNLKVALENSRIKSISGIFQTGQDGSESG